MHAIGKKGGALSKPNMYRDNLVSMMTELELVDTFRKQNRSKLSFTYESKELSVCSRIEFFLIAQSLTNYVSLLGAKVSTAPDHKAIKIT